MTTCANCSAEAKYSYHINDAILVHYCEKHLPHFLQAKKRAGLLPLLVPPVEVEPEKPAKKKKEEPAVVEAVAEEPVVEEESAPADADN